MIFVGMVFNVNLGFTDIENPTGKTEVGKNVAFFLGDTVVVSDVSHISWRPLNIFWIRI